MPTLRSFALAFVIVLAAGLPAAAAGSAGPRDIVAVRARLLDYRPPVPAEIENLSEADLAAAAARRAAGREAVANRDVRPMPLPAWPPPRRERAPGDDGAERELLTYDRASGEVRRERVAAVEERLLQRFTQAGIGLDELLEDPEGAAKNFNAWTPVTDAMAGDYPRRVKLIMNFIDANGQPVNGVTCSGTLIDPMHVITAAHCIWSHDIDGRPIGGFATEVEVIPGFDDWDEPLGSAGMTQLHVWGNWPDNYDYDHDVGVIDLDRPLGALAGWFGYGYDTGCDSWESGGWRHEGWPAETPYDGMTMHANSGSFDDCDEEGWVNVATWEGPSWGGSSGSGSLKSSTGSVYAVLSTSDRESITSCCKVTPVKFADIGTIIAQDQPPAVDLIVLDVNAAPDVQSGSRLGYLDFMVLNYSAVSQSSLWHFSMYLSTDDVITVADTYLGNGSFIHGFTPGDRLRVSLEVPPLISAGQLAGQYFVGVILNYADWNVVNNSSQGWDAASVTVDCPPRLTPQLVSPADGGTCLASDQYFSWQATVPYAEYQLQIGTACGQGETIDLTTNSYSYYGLALGTTYYWRVRSLTQCAGWGDWSSCRSFRTLANTTQITAPVQPADGAVCRPTNTTLQWQPLPDAQTYDVQISPNWCYEGAITTGITGTSLPVSGLTPGTTHYWRVRAHTVCGQTTDWSSVPGFCWTFRTAPSATVAPTRIGPGDGTTCGAANTVLIWNHVTDHDSYDVQVGTACGTGTTYNVTSNAFTAPGLQSGVTYYWRVRSRACGLTSSWTSCWSFSLDLEPPLNPTTLSSSSHVAAQWSNDNTVDVSWNWGWDNCAGSWPQYATLWDRSPSTLPTVPTTSGEMTSETSPPLPDADDHWFHVRTVDYAGNPAPTALHLGPFKIDTVAPSQPQLDYCTHDPRQIVGPGQITLDWLPSTDVTSGVARYDWSARALSLPPALYDHAVGPEVRTLTHDALTAGPVWLFVRAVDAAGNRGPALSHGQVIIESGLPGVTFLTPVRDAVWAEGSRQEITWNLRESLPPSLSSGRLDYSLDGGANYALLANLTLTGVRAERYQWTIPAVGSENAVLRMRLTDVTGGSSSVRSLPFTLLQVSAVPGRDGPAGDRFALEPAQPNPFNPRTTLAFNLPVAASVRLGIYDLTGRLVRLLVDYQWIDAGRHEETWDGADQHGLPVAAGVYFCRFEAAQYRETRSLVLVK